MMEFGDILVWIIIGSLFLGIKTSILIAILYVLYEIAQKQGLF